MSSGIQSAVAQAIERHRDRKGALLPLLHDIQHELGHVPAEAVEPIARALNLSRAEVHGVVTYYTHFRSRKPAQHLVQLCQAEACQAMGAADLATHAQARLGCAMQASSADNRYALEAVYCLGLCASSPSMMIGERVFGRVTPGRFDRVIASIDEASA